MIDCVRPPWSRMYGRILTVLSTDLTAFGLYTQPRSRFSRTDRLGSVNKMFIKWERRKLEFVYCNCLAVILLAHGDELNQKHIT